MFLEEKVRFSMNIFCIDINFCAEERNSYCRVHLLKDRFGEVRQMNYFPAERSAFTVHANIQGQAGNMLRGMGWILLMCSQTKTSDGT